MAVLPTQVLNNFHVSQDDSVSLHILLQKSRHHSTIFTFVYFHYAPCVGKKYHDLVPPEQDGPFITMLNGLSLNGNNDQKEQAGQPIPQSHWSAYLQSRIRASKDDPEQLEMPADFVRELSVESGVASSAGHKGKGWSRERPSSVACVDGGHVDRTFSAEMLRNKWLNEGRKSRYNFVSTQNITQHI